MVIDVGPPDGEGVRLGCRSRKYLEMVNGCFHAELAAAALDRRKLWYID